MDVSECLLTAEELADRLAVSPRTIIHWAATGRIPEIRLSSRLRRFDYSEVVASLKARRCEIKAGVEGGGTDCATG